MAFVVSLSSFCDGRSGKIALFVLNCDRIMQGRASFKSQSQETPKKTFWIYPFIGHGTQDSQKKLFSTSDQLYQKRHSV
jgi:S-methylmethionine-dependent homocysteine/selenocysteine methylase